MNQDKKDFMKMLGGLRVMNRFIQPSLTRRGFEDTHILRLGEPHRTH
jgi:hypothetical protein